MKKNRPPARAHAATTPTTAPAATPALLVPLDFPPVLLGCRALVWPGAVTTTVLACVIMEGGRVLALSGCGVDVEASVAAALVVWVEPEDEVLDAPPLKLPTVFSNPVN